MAKIKLLNESNWPYGQGLADYNKEDELTNFVAPQFDHNMGFNYAQYTVGEFDNTIPEDLEYSHASDATKDNYEITEEQINDIIGNIDERIKYYMPGSVEVSVKEKCRIGGNGDGTSTACNQGDINNLNLKPIPAEGKEVDNIPNQLHEDNHDFKFKKKDDPEYGCLMLELYIPNWDKIVSFVDKDNVYNVDDLGLETWPHVTLLYGFHDNVTSDEVFELYKSITSIQPIDINITGISYFETDDFDVVKFDVEPTKTLKRLNRYMKELPYTNDYPDFSPHVTISYLKKGTGKKYDKQFNNIKHLISNKLVFSDKDSNKTTLDLDNKPKYQQTSESVIKNIINNILNEDVDGQPEKQNMLDVKYVDQTVMKNEKCSSCGWFNTTNNNQCGIVEGQINPEGWCKLWGTKKFCNEQIIK